MISVFLLTLAPYFSRATTKYVGLIAIIHLEHIPLSSILFNVSDLSIDLSIYLSKPIIH